MRPYFLLMISSCAPFAVVDDVNRELGRNAVSFAADCSTSVLHDDATKCVVIVWRSLPGGRLGRTFPPPASYMPWTIALDESIRDDENAIRRALVHEIGHVLGLPDDPVSGRVMSAHLSDLDVQRMVRELPIELSVRGLR